MQPWRVYAVAGAKKDELSRALVSAFLEGRDASKSEYRYYPDEFFEPYLSRRRKVGWDLYDLLGIKKGETVRMLKQHARNFEFFGAPVGLLFTIDRRLEIGSWLDYGMFLENIMVAARGHGLDTCAQAAWTHYHRAIRPVLGLAEEEIVVCGMALGYADQDAPENTLQTVRARAREFMRFEGFA
jgi:nitroreductase